MNGAGKYNKINLNNKYKIVYKTTNLINGKTYIGVHATNNLKDKYIGCGVKSNSTAIYNANRRAYKTPFIDAVVKYGYNKFKREILFIFDTYEEALNMEKLIVNEEFIKDKSNYNISVGGDNVQALSGSENVQSKPLAAYDSNGDYLNKYPCASEAAAALNLNSQSINCVMQGKNNSLKGFRFVRINSMEDEVPNKIEEFKEIRGLNKSKKISITDHHSNTTEILESKMELIRKFKLSKGSVDFYLYKRKTNKLLLDRYHIELY